MNTKTNLIEMIELNELPAQQELELIDRVSRLSDEQCLAVELAVLSAHEGWAEGREQPHFQSIEACVYGYASNAIDDVSRETQHQ